MIHRGLIELSNIDIPLKTLRVYVVMVTSRAFGSSVCTRQHRVDPSIPRFFVL